MDIQYIIMFLGLFLGFISGALILLYIISRIKCKSQKLNSCKENKAKTKKQNNQTKNSDTISEESINLKNRMREHNTSYLEKQCENEGRDLKEAILSSRSKEDWNFTGMKRTMDKQKNEQKDKATI